MYKTWKRTETGKRVEIKKLEQKQGKRRKESRKLNVTTDKTGQGWDGENGSRKGEHFKCYLHLNHGKEGYS